MVMMMVVVVDVMQLSRLSVWVSDTLVIFDSLLFFHTKVLMYTGDRADTVSGVHQTLLTGLHT